MSHALRSRGPSAWMSQADDSPAEMDDQAGHDAPAPITSRSPSPQYSALSSEIIALMKFMRDERREDEAHRRLADEHRRQAEAERHNDITIEGRPSKISRVGGCTLIYLSIPREGLFTYSNVISKGKIFINEISASKKEGYLIDNEPD